MSKKSLVVENITSKNVKVISGKGKNQPVYNDQLVDTKAIPSLLAYLGRVEAGNSSVFTTPMSAKHDIDTMLNDWSVIMEQSDSMKSWPSLLDYESDMLKNVGPLSVMKPVKERLSDIMAYYDDISLQSSPIPLEAKMAVRMEWQSRNISLRLKSRQSTINDMVLRTSSGLPFFKKRRYSYEDMQSKLVGYGKGWITGLSDIIRPDTLIFPNGYEPQSDSRPNKYFVPTALLGWRGQEHGPEPKDVKQRVVWMFPFSVNIEELRGYQPLIKALQNVNPMTGLPYVPAWVSSDAVDLGITRLFDTKSAQDPVICTDFSRFDQHFNSDMQECARWLLKGLFSVENLNDHDYHDTMQWIGPTFETKYSIPLLIAPNMLLYGQHGMASGSGGTNADETLVHRCLQHEAAIVSNRNRRSYLNPYSQCLGDDGVLTYPGITVDKVVDVYSSHGQEMNPDKQYVSTEDCVYLRRWHHKDYRPNGTCAGVYSTYRALGRLYYTERYMDKVQWSREDITLRALSILENCKWHPLFREFVDFVCERDIYHLGLDIPSFFDRIATIASERVAEHPDLLGYTKTNFNTSRDLNPSYGIGEWEVVKYLKSKQTAR